MIENGTNPWYLRQVDPDVVDRLAALHSPHDRAERMGVDIVGDPHREDNDGYNWTRLSYARNVRDAAESVTTLRMSSRGTSKSPTTTPSSSSTSCPCVPTRLGERWLVAAHRLRNRASPLHFHTAGVWSATHRLQTLLRYENRQVDPAPTI
jgi:hypothetical protein